MFPQRIVAALLALGGAVCSAQENDFRKNLAPYVPMPTTIVEEGPRGGRNQAW